MLKRFIPDAYAKDIYSVNYKKLKENGIKCILIDVDNTITPARDSVFYEELRVLFNKLKKDFKIVLFSNNFPKREMILSRGCFSTGFIMPLKFVK